MARSNYVKILTCLLFSTLLFMACATQPIAEPDDSASSSEMSDATENTPAEAPASDATITIWADDTRAPILLELGAEFEEAYGVGLVVEQVADIRDQFVVAAPADEGPDIIVGAHDWLGQLVASGLLAPVDLTGKEADFAPASIDAFTFDGTLYGMPYAVENLAFFRNVELVPDAPATWDEVVAMGTALQDSGDASFGFALTGTTYDAFPVHTSFGGYIFGRNDAGIYDPTDVGIDSEGMIAAGSWLSDLVEVGFMPDSTDWDTNHTLFETGEIPFIMAGPWALDRLRASGVPYAISNFPDGGQPFLGVQGFMVNALSENVLLAQAFLNEFVATESTMLALQEAGNRSSALTAAAAASTDEDLVALSEAGLDAIPMPAIPEMGSVWGSWGDSFTLILTGEQNAEEALANGANQIRDLIGGAASGMVNIPGSHQDEIGCDGDWDPACVATALQDNGDGTYSATFTIAAGEYETKVALDGAWTVNYGVDGKQDGDNYTYSVDVDGPVTFVYDSATNLLDIAVGE